MARGGGGARPWPRTGSLVVLAPLLLTQLSWCCTDLEGWRDTQGNSCEDYVAQGACPQFATGPYVFGFQAGAVDGVSAMDACCECQCTDLGPDVIVDDGGYGCELYHEHPEFCGCCDGNLKNATRDCCVCALNAGKAANVTDWQQVFDSWPENATRLDFREKGLVGELQQILGRFKRLEYVDLSFNKLTGTIPAEIARFSKLRMLRLDGNAIQGPLPRELGQLTRLEELSLEHNNLTGPLPDELGGCQALNFINLQGNRLSGSIPGQLGNISRLFQLTLTDNELTGALPRELGTMTELRVLTLGYNKLNGSLTVFGNQTKLGWLDLSGNAFTGEIPPQLGHLRSLQLLLMRSNQLTGSIPPELGQLTSLRELLLQDNRLTGMIPAELAGLRSLTRLTLRDNELSGQIPPELGQLISLVYLDVASNQLEGPIPAELGQLTHLYSLVLNDNRLVGRLPAALANLANLDALDLNGNAALTGAIVAPPRLRSLTAAGCNFTSVDGLPDGVAIVDLTNNRVTQAPFSVSGLTKLLLSGNRIAEWPPYGVLPEEARRARICGTAPLKPRLNWTKLEVLDVSNNPLNVPIYTFLSSLAYLKELRQLNATGCGLHSSVPVPISNSTETFVDDVYFGDSRCAGSFIRSGFTRLAYVDFSRNSIESIAANPPLNLASVELAGNPLTSLTLAWFNLGGAGKVLKLDVTGAPSLQLPVALEGDEAALCPLTVTKQLVADPRSWRALPDRGDVECTLLCMQTNQLLLSDATLNDTVLCRCKVGYGQGSDCRPCPDDSYSVPSFAGGAWRRRCEPCPEHSRSEGRASGGGVQQDAGIERCRCEVGRFMNLSSGTCEPCQQWPFRTTLGTGTTDSALCVCNADMSAGGFVGLLERPLEQGRRCGCPDGQFLDHVSRRCADCSTYEDCSWGQGRFLQSVEPPPVLPGYWAAEPAPQDEQGLRQFSGHEVWRCASSRTCKGGHECDGNREGKACSLCEPGYFGGQDGPCRRCPGTPSESRQKLWLAVAASMVVPVVINKLLQADADADKTGFVVALRSLRTWRSILRFCQVMAITSGFNVRWPAAVQPFFRVMEAVSLDVASWTGTSCLVGWSSMTTEITAQWLLPFLAIFVTFAAAVLVTACARFCGPCARRRPALSKRLRMTMGPWDCVRVLVFLLGVFFPALLSSTLTVFTCMPPLYGHWEAYGWTVKNFPHVECADTKDNWLTLAVISAILAVALAVAYPYVAYSAWTRECSTRLRNGFVSGGWWRFFFDDFRAVHMDWALTMIYKDIAINAVACVGAGYGAFQLMATAVISLTYSYKCIKRLPYVDMSINALEVWNGVALAILCTLTAGMGFQTEPGVGDVSQLFGGGAEDPKYLQRAWTLVAVQVGCAVGPVGVVTYQILMSFERTSKLVPKRFRPQAEEERAQWIGEFCSAMRMPEAEATEFRRVLHELDDVDHAAFQQVMQRSIATLGLLPSSGGVRRRMSTIARADNIMEVINERRVSRGISLRKRSESGGSGGSGDLQDDSPKTIRASTFSRGISDHEETEALLSSALEKLQSLPAAEAARFSTSIEKLWATLNQAAKEAAGGEAAAAAAAAPGSGPAPAPQPGAEDPEPAVLGKASASSAQRALSARGASEQDPTRRDGVVPL